MAKKKQNDSMVYIGRKKTINYVLAAMVVLNEERSVKLLARGKSISRAVDVGEILRHKYIKGAQYGKILITTEELTNKDGSNTNVSSMEIEILPPK